MYPECRLTSIRAQVLQIHHHLSSKASRQETHQQGQIRNIATPARVQTKVLHLRVFRALMHEIGSQQFLQVLQLFINKKTWLWSQYFFFFEGGGQFHKNDETLTTSCAFTFQEKWKEDRLYIRKKSKELHSLEATREVNVIGSPCLGHDTFEGVLSLYHLHFPW